MHGNKILRSNVDIEKSINAAVAQVKVGQTKQVGLAGRSALGANVKPSWIRRWMSKAFQRMLPLLKAVLTPLREFMNFPVANTLAQMEARNASSFDSISERLSLIEMTLGTRTPVDVVHTDPVSQWLQQLTRIEAYSQAAARRTVINCGDGRVLVKSSVGYVMCSTQDTLILACLVDTGELEQGTRLLIEHIVRPSGTFIDVGANIGLHTLAAARAMRGLGKVVAFEPFSGTRALLTESVFINGFSQMVEIHEAAVASQSGAKVLYLGKTSGHHSLYPLESGQESEQKTVQVALVTLSDVVSPHERVDLIKIDVEGAELDVLESARPLIEANPELALIVEFGPSHLMRTGCDVADWFAAFSALGLTYQAIDPVSGALRPASQEQLETVESTNLLFARPDSPVWTRACGKN